MGFNLAVWDNHVEANNQHSFHQAKRANSSLLYDDMCLFIIIVRKIAEKIAGKPYEFDSNKVWFTLQLSYCGETSRITNSSTKLAIGSFQIVSSKGNPVGRPIIIT